MPVNVKIDIVLKIWHRMIIDIILRIKENAPVQLWHRVLRPWTRLFHDELLHQAVQELLLKQLLLPAGGLQFEIKTKQ